MYNNITNFVNEYLKPEYITEYGFIVKENRKIIPIETKPTLKDMQDIVDGYIELVSYVEDDNYEVIVNENGLSRDYKFNLFAYGITGYYFYGDVLILKKGVLK